MKTLRLLFALCCASALTSAWTFAADDKSEKPQKCCECSKDADGKTCGVDKDCCCTGKKAEKPAEKKS